MSLKKSVARIMSILLTVLFSFSLSHASPTIRIEDVEGKWTGRVAIKVNSIVTPSEKYKQEALNAIKEIEAKEQAFELLVQPGSKLLFNFTDYGNLLDYSPDGTISGRHETSINTSDSTFNAVYEIQGQITETSEGLTLKMDIGIQSISKIDYGEGLIENRFSYTYTYTMSKKGSAPEKIDLDAPVVEKETEHSNTSNNSPHDNDKSAGRNQVNKGATGTSDTGSILEKTAGTLEEVNSSASGVLPILSSINAIKMTNLDIRAFQHFYDLHNGNMEEVKKELDRYMNAKHTGSQVKKAEGKNPVYRIARSIVSNLVGGTAGSFLSLGEGAFKSIYKVAAIIMNPSGNEKNGVKPEIDNWASEMPDIKGHTKRIADGVSEIIDIIAGKGKFVDKIDAIKDVLSTEKAKQTTGGGTRG